MSKYFPTTSFFPAYTTYITWPGRTQGTQKSYSSFFGHTGGFFRKGCLENRFGKKACVGDTVHPVTEHRVKSTVRSILRRNPYLFELLKMFLSLPCLMWSAWTSSQKGLFKKVKKTLVFCQWGWIPKYYSTDTFFSYEWPNQFFSDAKDSYSDVLGALPPLFRNL